MRAEHERERELTCPRCGQPLNYDRMTGLWWCPDTECGTVVKREVHRHTAGTAGPFVSSEPVDEEWQPERPGVGRRVVLVVGAIVVIISILAMVLSPLIWPRRPVLSVSPQSIQFDDVSGDPALPRAFAIQNDGKGELSWQITGDRDWITVEPASGTIDEGIEVVTVSVDVHGMPAGSHAGTCTITASGAYNSPRTVSVIVTLSLPPEGRALKEVLGKGADVSYGEQPPYADGPTGRSIALTNNENATDVSWDELIAFILADGADENPYVEDVRMCGSFAEEVHNSAEANGIRSAWVSVDFEGTDIGHALNAFVTTDKGLVFVDCTGSDASFMLDVTGSGDCDCDKVAYVAVGKPYGLISADYAQSPSYSFYEEYCTAWGAYLKELDEYNSLVAEYNQLAASGAGADLRRARRLAVDLQSRRIELEMDQQVLGPCQWEQLGIVEQLHMYW